MLFGILDHELNVLFVDPSTHAQRTNANYIQHMLSVTIAQWFTVTF